MLYQRPQADMAGEWHLFTRLFAEVCVRSSQRLNCATLYADCAEKLFDLVDSFAESAKRKAAVWPLQIILLILCPEITQSITKEVGGEEKANKVRLLFQLNSLALYYLYEDYLYEVHVIIVYWSYS